MDTVGYIYDTPFDPSNPLANLITDDDDSGDSSYQFHIDVNLQSGRTYILVVTTHWEYTRGDYSISVTGPASVGLMSITPSTSRPIVTPSTAPSVSSLYAGTLSSSSPVFIRPNSGKQTDSNKGSDLNKTKTSDKKRKLKSVDDTKQPGTKRQDWSDPTKMTGNDPPYGKAGGSTDAHNPDRGKQP
ncbi:unnamed protein product [Rotaria sordida]|uniref:Uncharacterized protein n=1 Tax=Rotaria sordida TaxID=392033 RepID=A0A815CH16_9BILA|nr:unnamed protein product [Rotaria sordida]